jgi:hypothetical protein
MSDKTKHCGCESLRDQFAAAALTGLLVAHQEDAVDDVVRWSFNWADSMLAERAKLTPKSASVSNDEAPESKADAMPRTPETDRLTEWERHGSHRWGLGVASDLYDLECRVAALEAAAAHAHRSGAGGGDRVCQSRVDGAAMERG